MNIDVQEILNDLYKIDPTLAEKEAELKEIIEKLAGNKPTSEPDHLFKERLKQELLNKIENDRSRTGSTNKAADPQPASRAGQSGDAEQKRKILPFRRVAIFRAAGITAAAAFAVIFGMQFFNIREDGISPVGESIPPVSSGDVELSLVLDDEEGEDSVDEPSAALTAKEDAAVSDEDTAGAPAEKDSQPAPVERETAADTAAESPAPIALTEEEETFTSEEVSEFRVSPEAEPMISAVPAPEAAADSGGGEQGFLGRFFSRNSERREEMSLMKQAAPTSGLAMDMVMAEEPAGYYVAEDFNTEEYDRIHENDFITVTDEPMSTFSIDVDTASYANVRRYLNDGSLPPADAVRIEELINYFDYDYPVPENTEAPFSFTTETTRAPWNEENLLLKIGLKGYEVSREEMPPSNLVFLLDVSGSMSDANKLPLLKKSMALLIDTLDEDDRVSIVAYAGAAGLVLPPTAGNNRETILSAMDRLEAGGSTAGGEGIELAYQTALKNFEKNGNNRVIIATDGDFNVGPSSQGELTRMIEEKREQGIFLTVLGLGMGNYKDSRMESIADSGNGNYAYIDTINEARKVLVNEMESTLLTIAKDVKIQIEFNPTVVESYRLIGYENRVMANRDFDDDTKDAGEIGAGHTVTALYEIVTAVPAGAGSSSAVETPELRYQETTVRPEASDDAAFADELAFIKFRYKAPAGDTPDADQSTLITSPIVYRVNDFGQASTDFRFAASVAEWGMKLRDSSHLPEEETTDAMKDLIGTVRNAMGEDEYGYRAEFLTLLYKTMNLME